MQNGRLIVLTGPSGVGKGTLLQLLRQRHPELYISISATTRDPRPGEIDGRDYEFLSRDRFVASIENGELLEWAEFAGNYYGTPRASVERQIAQGKWVILEIELEGARQIRRHFPDALLIFVLPPSFEELENRLRGRNQDDVAAIERRLERAKKEIAASEEFDVRVVNDDLEKTVKQLEDVLFSNAVTSSS
ncbi:Guanylate kinase [Geitlerinema sp. FC II]|uniref:guanylate kinase n=1 Tax=Baaleninema simplex TaxID=2862350 RepID=UPI000346521D|nr:guanylate kinase [Baaleninema simplex]PPT06907.1 Guanylate kinase [Geitlerinema sp. FC II]